MVLVVLQVGVGGQHRVLVEKRGAGGVSVDAEPPKRLAADVARWKAGADAKQPSASQQLAEAATVSMKSFFASVDTYTKYCFARWAPDAPQPLGRHGAC